MNPKTRFALIALLALLAVVAGFIAAGYKYRQQFVVPGISLSESTRASEQLLALTLADASAVSQPLSQWRGKLLVVNFWATWCPPCREEMPGFSRLNTKFTSKSVQFVGIAIDHADKVRNIRFKHLLHTRSWLEAQGSCLIDGLGNTRWLAFTVIIGRDGTLRQTRLGLWKESALEDILADLAKES